MHRDVLVDCLPFVLAMAASVVVARGLIAIGGAGQGAGRPRWSHLWRLHRDEHGAVQSLSFVLTLPVFVMLMLFIVQLSQMTIARVAVEYAAYAAARSAQVWIPANLGDTYEEPNCVGYRIYIGETRDELGNNFDVYQIVPPSRKLSKVHLAAAMALMPICPSRDLGFDFSHPGNAAAASFERAYVAFSPTSTSNTRIPTRLRNKLAYALESTSVRLEVRHKHDEPPLVWHDLSPYREEFELNEIGWQDQLLLTVIHDFALLPGPARFLSRTITPSSGTTDEVASRIQRRGNVFTCTMTAMVRLSNEGEKPEVPYVQPWSLSGFETPMGTAN